MCSFIRLDNLRSCKTYCALRLLSRARIVQRLNDLRDCLHDCCDGGALCSSNQIEVVIYPKLQDVCALGASATFVVMQKLINLRQPEYSNPVRHFLLGQKLCCHAMLQIFLSKTLTYVYSTANF